MTHTADDMHDDAPMTEAVSAEAVAGLVGELKQIIPYTMIPLAKRAAATITTLAAEVEALRRERDEAKLKHRRLHEDFVIVEKERVATCIALKHHSNSSMPVSHAAREAVARADSLAAELAQCREATVEECAKVADSVLRGFEDMDGPRQTVVARIRALPPPIEVENA